MDQITAVMDNILDSVVMKASYENKTEEDFKNLVIKIF